MVGGNEDRRLGDRASGTGARIVRLPTAERVEVAQRRSPSPNARNLVFLLALASALAAGLSPGRPTGVGVADFVLRFVVGGAGGLLGAYATWPYLAAGALAAVVGSFEEAALLPAVAALGASLASVAPGQRRFEVEEGRGAGLDGFSVLYAAIGATVVQVALRLSWPHVSLGPSLLAAVAILVILVGGVRGAPTRVRRYALGSAAALAAAAVALAVVAGASILMARSSLSGALQATHLGLKAAELGEQKQAQHQFTLAESGFRRAHSDLGVGEVAEVVPVAAQQVRALRVAASLGLRLTATARHTAAAADISALKLSDGVFPVDRLARLGPLFASDISVIDSCLHGTAAFHSPWLVGPIASKLTAFEAKLRRARHDASTAELASHVVPGLLGADGKQRYLLLFENPAESRASGGVIGDFAVATAQSGKLNLVRTGSVEQLDHDGDTHRTLIGPAGYIARYSQFQPQYSWENVPMSPDFPSVAEVAANLFPQSGGKPVNEVISIDPVALEGLLKATGPVEVPGWNLQISYSNVVSALANGEFIHFGSDNAARIAYLQVLIKQIWHELVTRPLPPLPSLASDLAPAIRGGHLHMWSSVASEEQFFDDVHVSGAMPPDTGDFLGVVTQNAAGNKIDWYLRRTVGYHSVLNPATRIVTATLTLRLTNLAPLSGLPGIVIDPAPGSPAAPGECELYISVYSRWLASGASIDGKPLELADQRELGRYVYSALVGVPSGATRTLVVHLTGHWPSSRKQFKLSYFTQPLLHPDAGSRTATVRR